jgi:hypothetical protein
MCSHSTEQLASLQFRFLAPAVVIFCVASMEPVVYQVRLQFVLATELEQWKNAS